jgi:hypothetical protein
MPRPESLPEFSPTVREQVVRKAETVPPLKPRLPEAGVERQMVGEKKPLFEAAAFDDQNELLQVYQDPENGGLVMVRTEGKNDYDKKNSSIVARETRHLLETDMGRLIGKGKIAEQKPYSMHARSAEVLNPRDEYVANTLRISMSEGLRFAEAEREAHGSKTEINTVAAIVYDRPAGPEQIYGVPLDSKDQRLPRIELGFASRGETLGAALDKFLLDERTQGRESNLTSLLAIRNKLSEEKKLEFDQALDEFAKARLEAPMVDLISDDRFADALERLRTAAPEAADELDITLVALASGVETAKGKYAREPAADTVVAQLTWAEKNAETTQAIKKALNTVGERLGALGITKKGADQQKEFDALLTDLKTDLQDLNPDARLYVVENAKRQYEQNIGRLKAAEHEALDRLREPELPKEAEDIQKIYDSLTFFLRGQKSAESRKLTGRALAPQHERIVNLSPEAKITLYDRLERNGFLDKGSEAAQELLSDKRLQLALSGESNVYLVTEKSARNVTEELKTQGHKQDLNVSYDPNVEKTKTVWHHNLAVRPGTIVVITDKPMFEPSLVELTARRDLEQTREALPESQSSGLVMFRVK